MKKKVFATLLAVSMIASMVPAAVSVQAADGDSIRLVVKKQNSIQKDQPKAATGLTKPLRIPTMQFATD